MAAIFRTKYIWFLEEGNYNDSYVIMQANKDGYKYKKNIQSV